MILAPLRVSNKIQIQDPNDLTRLAGFDELLKALVVIPSSHSHIHDGHRFFYSELITLASAGTRDILIATPDTTKWAHFTELSIAGNKETNVKVYEDTTTSADGTGLTEINRNRNSGTVNTTVLTHTPTVSDVGTLIFEVQFGEATGPASSRAGGAGATRQEVILKQNTKYLIRITSAANDNDISNFFDWYEHTSE